MKQVFQIIRRFVPLNSPIRKAWYFGKAFLAAVLYRFPARKMKLIGITGTDGKTTTVGMISSILREAGIPHLKISTASIFLNGREWENISKRTTLSPFQTNKLLRQAIREHVSFGVLEVSSHATEQKRIWGIHFDIAGITNITEEHLDDHGGFAAYANAKKKLFTEYLKTDGIAVLNADDPTVASWESEIQQKKIWTSRKNEKDITAHMIESSESGTHFSIRNHKFTLPLLGEFNVENALIAYGASRMMNIDPKFIAMGFEKFHGTPGRLEKVDLKKDFEVYVDDALTPNAIENGLLSLRKKSSGKTWAVFGCCGTRDKGKRPKIGRIVGELADYVVLTDDEPYTEPADQIREQVKEGLRTTHMWTSSRFREIPDRREAIRFALQNAQKGDAVFIFGMGSYTSRNIGGEEIPWSDKKVIEEESNS